MPFQIPNPTLWMSRCAHATPEQLQAFIKVLRTEFIAPRLADYHAANARVHAAQVRHIGRPSYDDRSTRPAKASPKVAQYKLDRQDRRTAQHALQVLVRAEELARMQLQQRQPDGNADRELTSVAALLLSFAVQLPAPMLVRHAGAGLHAMETRFRVQNLTADKAAIAQEVLARFPGMFGAVDRETPAAAQADAAARDALLRKLLRSVTLDAAETLLLRQVFNLA